MDGWYYKVFDIEFGPVKFEKLIELAKSQEFSRDDQVRFGEKGQWRRVGTIGQLMAHLPFESVAKPIGPTMFPTASEFQGSKTNGHHSEGSPISAATNGHHAEAADSKEFDRRWWCKIQDREYGPVELPKLIEWATTGRLMRDDQVRFGQDPYVQASELPGLFPEQTKPGNNGTAS